MGNINPSQFSREVRQEIAKVTWPTRKETTVTTAMVMVMVVICAIFFLLIDQFFAMAVRLVLGLGG